MKTVLLMMILNRVAVAGDAIHHPLDRANLAIRDGDYAAAAELSQQSLDREIAAEGYNTLALALEHLGRYDEAVRAYEAALDEAPREDGIKRNLRRATIRNMLNGSRQGLTWSLIVSMVVAYVLPIGKGLILKRAHRKRQSQIEQITVLDKRLGITSCLGDVEFASQIYPDTQQAFYEVHLKAASRSIGQLSRLALVLEPPKGGALIETTECEVGRRESGDVSLSFCLNGLLDGIKRESGLWNLHVSLHPGDSVLMKDQFESVSRSRLLDNLKVRKKTLMVRSGDKSSCETVIPNTCESVSFQCEIIARDYCRSKYAGMVVDVCLAESESSDLLSTTTPLDFAHGPVAVSLECPVARSARLRRPGNYEFKLSSAGKVLAKKTFRVIDGEQIVRRLRVTDIAMEKICPRLGNRDSEHAATPYSRFIGATVTFRAEQVSGLVSVPVALGMCVNGKPAGKFKEDLVIGDRRITWNPGRFVLPRKYQAVKVPRVELVVFVKGKPIATQCLEIS